MTVAAGSLHRHALLQPGADDGAGRADPRPADRPTRRIASREGVRAKRLGKTPIVVKNSPGFVVNRILCPMINEAIFALQEGLATAEDIDNGMKLGCNHPIGPLALADMIGLDVLLAVMHVFYDGLQRSEVPAGAAAEGDGRGGLSRPQDQARLLPLRLTAGAALRLGRLQRLGERSDLGVRCVAAPDQERAHRAKAARQRVHAELAALGVRSRARSSASRQRPCRRPRSRGLRGTSPSRRCGRA